jgi:hypothetical protein
MQWWKAILLPLAYAAVALILLFGCYGSRVTSVQLSIQCLSSLPSVGLLSPRLPLPSQRR